jgi:hypothetical protein
MGLDRGKSITRAVFWARMAKSRKKSQKVHTPYSNTDPDPGQPKECGSRSTILAIASALYEKIRQNNGNVAWTVTSIRFCFGENFFFIFVKGRMGISNSAQK